MKKSMDNFVVIDFEMVNNECISICSVGVVIVRNGEIVDWFYSFVYFELDYYLYWNICIYGLIQEDIVYVFVFLEVWKQVVFKIEGFLLVVYNKVFDEGCLKVVFCIYCMDYFDYDFYCIYQVFWKLKGLRNYQLYMVVGFFGFELENYYYVLVDVEVCVWIVRQIL